MLAAFLRSAARAVLAPLLAAIMAYVLGYIIPFMRAPDGHIIVRTFSLAHEHFLLVALVVIVVQLAARANAEGDPGGMR